MPSFHPSNVLWRANKENTLVVVALSRQLGVSPRGVPPPPPPPPHAIPARTLLLAWQNMDPFWAHTTRAVGDLQSGLANFAPSIYIYKRLPKRIKLLRRENKHREPAVAFKQSAAVCRLSILLANTQLGNMPFNAISRGAMSWELFQHGLVFLWWCGEWEENIESK